LKKERFQGLELLATAVVVSNPEGVLLYANLSAETLLEVSLRSLDGQALAGLFVEAEAFREFLKKSHADPFGVKRQVFELIRPSGTSEHVHVTLSRPDGAEGVTIIELREIEQQLKVDREARMMDQSLANKELIRNLAHEIKNPLGGIREFLGDLEQLIQAILNIVRNAAQALAPQILEGTAQITLCTRVVRRVTLNRKQHRLALDLQVIDNGPGIPVEIMERIFFPLVSGREGGSGLGLTLAQTFVQQHEGIIECSSTPGRTLFKVTLPLQFDHATS